MITLLIIAAILVIALLALIKWAFIRGILKTMLTILAAVFATVVIIAYAIV